jgi:uncharacterized membrane protein
VPDEERSDFSRWVADHRRLLQWAIVGLGLVFLLVTPKLSLLIAVVTVVVVALLVAGVELIAGPPAPPAKERVAATATDEAPGD